MRAAQAALSILGGVGDDTVNLGSLAPTTTGSVARNLAGPITVDGEAGTDTGLLADL